jgi:protoheme IX farnesyltransferase
LQRFSLRSFLTLIRFTVTLAVTFSAITAAVVYAGTVSSSMLLPFLGIFLLAAGASALNQYQEWPYDELMERTKHRPIPLRILNTSDALRYATIMIIGGSLLLLYFSNGTCFALGLLNVIWYNGLYTYLKRKTAFAVVPGALTGAIPVLMGWTAAGGDILDPVALLLAFFLFIWQMPHFWLLMLKYGDQYRKAGFPVLNDLFTNIQLKTIVMAWLLASSVASLLLIYFRILHLPIFGYTTLLLNMALLTLVFYQLFPARSINYKLIFITANLYMLLVFVALVTDSLLR